MFQLQRLLVCRIPDWPKALFSREVSCRPDYVPVSGHVVEQHPEPPCRHVGCPEDKLDQMSPEKGECLGPLELVSVAAAGGDAINLGMNGQGKHSREARREDASVEVLFNCTNGFAAEILKLQGSLQEVILTLDSPSEVVDLSEELRLAGPISEAGKQDLGEIACQLDADSHQTYASFLVG